MPFADEAWYHTAIRTLDSIYRDHLGRPIDLAGVGSYLYRQREFGATAEDIEVAVKASPEYRARHPFPPTPVPPFPPSPPTGPSLLVGRLRLSPTCFIDDHGPVNPIFCHLGDPFSRFVRDPSPVLHLLDTIVSAGYHGLRFWTVLGGPYWLGREVNCARDASAFERFGRALAERGLRVMLSQGDLWRPAGGASRHGVKQAILHSFPPDVIAFVDGGNEAVNDRGDTDPGQLAAWVSGLPGIKTLTSPPGELSEDLNAYSIDPAECYDVHGDRGGRWFDKIRHIRNVANPHDGHPPLIRWTGVQSEPFGPGTRVSVSVHKDELTADVMQAAAVMSYLARQVWVYFSGPGVISDESERLEDMPGFWETPPAVALLPRDIMAYERQAHGGQSGVPFVVTDNPGPKTMRVDQAIHADGRFAALAYGPNLSAHRQVSGTVESQHLFGDKAILYLGRA